ncbi:MAG: T9SS type A sorting domain-containing protein [Bacteroidia bacterium]|nr:T9SS type A sorting domain-containing protein [Bacteroidia bacterium]
MAHSRISRILALLVFTTVSLFVNGQKPGAYKCLDFDGTDDYVLISDDRSLNSDSTLAVEAWIKADAYGSNSYSNSIFCKHGWSRGNLGYVLRCGDNGRLSFNISDASGTWREAESARLMKTGVWYHVAGTYDGDSINLYINGKLVETTLVTTSISVSTGLTARIGDLANGGGRRFDGMIDEVRVWSTGVDQHTIRDWMCRKVDSSHPNFKNLSGYWKLDKDTGVVAIDASSKGNDGRLTNGPTISLSGAALGSHSAYTYSSSAITLATSYKDEVKVSNIQGSPDYFHVFVEYDKSDQPLASGQSGRMDTTHYFGVFYPNDTAVKYDFSYDFGNLKGLSSSDKCAISLYKKASGYTGTWSNSGAIYHSRGDSLTLAKQVTQEYVAVFQETDSNDILKSGTGKFYLCGNDSLELIASGNDSFSYTWYMNGGVLSSKTTRKIFVDSAAKYKVVVQRKSGTCTFTSATIDVKRTSKPSVSLKSFADVCEDVDTVILKGASPSGGVFAGTDVTDSLFFPSKVKSGTYTITYTFMDTTNCSNSASQDIQVNGLPSFNKVGVFEFCNNVDSVPLKEISPVGGTYNGAYYSNNFLHVDSTGYKVGFYPFVYSYTDGNGCSNSMVDSIEIKWATPCQLKLSKQACLNDDSIALTGSPIGGVFSGKGVKNSSFFPSQAGLGKHAVVYAFTNILNCTSTDTQYVDVIKNSPVSWNETLSVCINTDTIRLKEGSPSGGYFEGSGLSNTGLFNPSVAGVGKHLLAYVSIDANGCHNRSRISGEVKDTTTISFNSSPSVCLLGDVLALDFGLPTGGSYTGKGIINDTLYPDQAGFGNHSVLYRYTSPNGCISSGYSTLEVFKPDSISIIADQLLCSYDDPVVLKLYPSGGSLNGNGVIGSVFSPSLAGAGTHVVHYTLTDNQGCPNKDSIVFEVLDPPVVTIGDITSLCATDEAVLLTSGEPKDSGSYTVNGAAATQLDPAVLGVGVYTVQYKVVNHAGCSDSASTRVYINSLPPKPTISKVKNTLFSSANDGNQWYSASNGKLDGEVNKNLDAQQDDQYWVVVTNDSGCMAGSDTFDFAYVSVVDQLPSWVRVYPNPSNGVFKFEGLAEPSSVLIRDLQGRLVSARITEDMIDITRLPNGVYMLEFKSNSETYRLRLVKGR